MLSLDDGRRKITWGAWEDSASSTIGVRFGADTAIGNAVRRVGGEARRARCFKNIDGVNSAASP